MTLSELIEALEEATEEFESAMESVADAVSDLSERDLNKTLTKLLEDADPDQNQIQRLHDLIVLLKDYVDEDEDE